MLDISLGKAIYHLGKKIEGDVLNSTRSAIAGNLQSRVFYGWVMVLVAGIGLFASGPGQSHTFSVFNQLIADDLGLSLTDVSWAYGIGTTAAAFMLPIVGRQVDQYGPRKSLIFIVIGLGFACVLFGAVANLLWLVVGFALLRFLGQGSLMLGSSNLVARWFTTKRGLAMSLMALGFGLSIAVHPKLAQYLIELYGWRSAWTILGFMTWILMLPVLLLLVFDRPSILGLHPDNEVPADGNTSPELTGPDVAGALRHPAFYIICAAWFGLSALVTALHYHQINIMELQGLTRGTATNSFVVSSITMVCLMPFVGRVFDKFRTRFVLAAGLCVQSLAIVSVTFVDSIPIMVVYAMIFGLNNAFTMTFMGYAWARYFGQLHLGKIQGTGQMVAVIGASLGPIPVSWALDTYGDPSTMLWWLALYPLVIAVIGVLFLSTHPAVKASAHLD